MHTSFIVPLTLLSIVTGLDASPLWSSKGYTATNADFRHLPTLADGSAITDGKKRDTQHFLFRAYGGKEPVAWYAAPDWSSFCDLRVTQTLPLETSQETLTNVPYERFGFDAEGWTLVNYTLPHKINPVCRQGTPYRFIGYGKRQLFGVSLPLVPSSFAVSTPPVVKLTAEQDSLKCKPKPMSYQTIWHDARHGQDMSSTSVTTSAIAEDNDEAYLDALRQNTKQKQVKVEIAPETPSAAPIVTLTTPIVQSSSVSSSPSATSSAQEEKKTLAPVVATHADTPLETIESEKEATSTPLIAASTSSRVDTTSEDADMIPTDVETASIDEENATKDVVDSADSILESAETPREPAQTVTELAAVIEAPVVNLPKTTSNPTVHVGEDRLDLVLDLLKARDTEETPDQ